MSQTRIAWPLLPFHVTPWRFMSQSRLVCNAVNVPCDMAADPCEGPRGSRHRRFPCRRPRFSVTALNSLSQRAEALRQGGFPRDRAGFRAMRGAKLLQTKPICNGSWIPHQGYGILEAAKKECFSGNFRCDKNREPAPRGPTKSECSATSATSEREQAPR